MCQHTNPIIYLITLLLLALPIGEAVSAELPQIEMPEYIISGIEKATRLEGNRLLTSITSTMSVPGATAHYRPELIALPTWTPPSRKTLTTRLKPLLWSIGTTGGGFGMAAVSGDIIYNRMKVTRRANAAFHRPPRRINAGELSVLNAEYGEIHRISEKFSIFPGITYDQKEYTLLNGNGGFETRRSDLMLSLFVEPVMTPVGSFAGYIGGGGWEYSSLDDLSGRVGSFRLRHDLPAWSGRFEDELYYAAEEITNDDNHLQLIKFSTVYSLLLHSNISTAAGGVFYTGSTVDGGSVQGVQPHVKIEIRMPLQSILALTYRPSPEFHSFGNNLDIYPVLDTAVRGYITEDVSRLALRYSMFMNSGLELSVDGFRNETRHVTFAIPIPDTVDKWRPVSRRLSSKGFELKCEFRLRGLTSIGIFGRVEDARTSGAGQGDEATQIPESYAGFAWTQPLSWLTLKTDLTWCSSAPVDFTGATRRPERTLWNFSLFRAFNMGVSAELGVNNILNAAYYNFPHYDMAPSTFYVRLKYMG